MEIHDEKFHLDQGSVKEQGKESKEEKNKNQQKIEQEKKRKIDSKDFFYSESLDRYIATHPLKVDDRVVKAASECGIELNWDDEGRIKDIGYVEARKLAEKFGANLMSPSEYWKVYNEALETGNQALLEQLQSDQSTEWLDAIYEKDEHGNVWMIEHPEIVDKPEGVKFQGKRKKINPPYGRPGWFNPKDNIDQKTGLPIHVDVKREKGTVAWSSTTWKYWSVFKVN